MPANVVDIRNIRKHLTNAEKQARLMEQNSMSREKVKLSAPKYIKDDDVANGYWKTTIKRMKTLTLLDDLDSETLAMYCQILSRRDMLSAGWREGMGAATQYEDPLMKLGAIGALDEMLRRLEAQERLALQYAEKLGLTPSGRVRLAKKRAEERAIDPDADLYGD